jgi:hypothetical protein
MMKTKLAKAVSLAVAGAALSAGASNALASTTMYNTFTTAAATATDGWTRTGGPSSNGNTGPIQPWLGIGGSSTPTAVLPFNYTGSSHLNWAVQLNGTGDSATISAADSLSRYGVSAEIDTGGGAWNDNGLNASGVPTTTGPTGWRHQTDIGIIQTDVTQFVTLNLSTIGQTFSRFGVTVFQGMDTKTGNYSHHGAWNAPGATPPRPFSEDNPFGTTGLTNIGYSDNVTSAIGYTFLAQADTAYSIYLGGVGFSRWNAGLDGYALNITTSAVPVPGAVWLFGSAIAGLVGMGGRRKAAVAA